MTDKDKDLIVYGSKGPDEPDPPYEAPNTLQAKTNARFVDLLCEGEINGLADGDKSIYINDIPLQNDLTELYNYEGVSTQFRYGTPDQSVLSGFPTSESEISVGVEIKYGNPIARTLSSDDVDAVRVTLYIPSLFQQTDQGDILPDTISYRISIRPNGGTWTSAHASSKTGKCVSAYQWSIKISNLESYGAGPWDIRVEKRTEDSSSVKRQRVLYWSTYTEIIDRKLIYPDTALIGVEVDARKFGSQVPTRSYEIEGLLIKYPDNYNPETRAYTGDWTGTFTTGYTNNPAWVYYDWLTNDRYGLGVDESLVDKWTLYTIAQYCDGLAQDGYGNYEPRFTYNYAVTTQREAYDVINSLANCFRAMPIWATGLATVSQDYPRDPVKLLTEANVIGGLFTYGGTDIKTRYTVVNVSWNDPDDTYRPAIETVTDQEGIKRYGYRSVDVVAFACTSRGQAYRYGKWFLYSNQYETQTVNYKCGLDQLGVLPGDVIEIYDEHFQNKRLAGRVSSATTTSITLDSPVTLESGETYTISFVKPDGILEADVDITNTPADDEHTVINLDTVLDSTNVPHINAVWALKASNLQPRQFRVVKIVETDKHIFEVTAVLYDPNKYAIVEDGKQFDPVPYAKIPDANTPIIAPTNPWAEEYSYDDGENRLFGLALSWTPTSDVRFTHYQVQWKTTASEWSDVVDTAYTNYDVKPVVAGIYSFRVRACGLGVPSEWLTLTNINVYANPSVPPDISGLEVVNGDNAYTFNGRDCEIEWDAADLQVSDSTEYTYIDSSGDIIITDGTSLPPHAAVRAENTLTKLKDYQIEVLTTADVHLRYAYSIEPTFIYTYAMNKLDNGTPIRNIKFKVWIRDIYGQLSENAALIPTLGYATNPAPSMSGLTPTVTNLYNGLKIDWSAITPTDNDMSKFKVYCDTGNPPTTEIAEVGVNTTYWFEYGLNPNTTYRVQVEPWDVFGVGVKSDVVNGEPTKIALDDIEGELTARLEYTDSNDGTTSTLAELYDRVKDSGGVSYDNGDWIKVSFPLEQIIDRVGIWANKTFNCYVSIKSDGGSWYYYKAEADHTLDNEGRLLLASNEADAQTNYWTADGGDGSINRALMPNGLVGKECRLHILTNSTTIYELIFVDQVIAEWIVANQLSAISADLGTITAGVLQSNNFTSSTGILLDLDNDSMKFGGTTDPDIEFDGGTATIKIRDNGSLTIGTDGTLTIGDGGLLTVGEGGEVVVGDDNIIISGIGNSIIVAPDGGPSSNSYAELTDGDLDFFYWDGDEHILYNSMSRIEVGVCQNNAWTDIPGIWKTQPQVMVSPYELESYIGGRQSQTQKFYCVVDDIQLQNGETMRWKFKAKALLVLSSGDSGGSSSLYCQTTSSGSCYTSNISMPTGTRSASMSGYVNSKYTKENLDKNYHCYGCFYQGLKSTIYFQCYYDGAWHNVASKSFTQNYNNNSSYTLGSGTIPYDIKYIRLRVVGNGVSPTHNYQGSCCPSVQNILRGYIQSYTGGQAATNIIAEGSLNYIAIGY